MDIIIGRESGTSSPRLCIKAGDNSFFLGTPGSVPKTVSRSHCRLLINADGSMTISNVSDQNSLFVNGLEYKSKTITMSDLVELGPEHYRLDIASVLAMIKRGVPPVNQGEVQNTYRISHLRTVWENYSQGKMDIQVSQGKLNALSAIPGVLSMASIALSFIFPDSLRIVFITIAAILAISFVVVRLKNADRIPELQKEMDERFQDEYICPNCKHFLGNQSYKIVLKNGGCPWCKVKFKE